MLGVGWRPVLGREHGARRDPETITSIVVHTVGGPTCSGRGVIFSPIPFRSDDARFWRDALLSAPVADAHFVIGRNGQVEPVIPLSEVAQHVASANAASIGIELVHRGDGHEPFEPRQIDSLILLIKKLRHDLPRISINNIVGHSDLDQRTCTCNGAPFRRRQDPGDNFPWAKVLAAIRRPDDPPLRRPTRAPLVGPATGSACHGER